MAWLKLILLVLIVRIGGTTEFCKPCMCNPPVATCKGLSSIPPLPGTITTLRFINGNLTQISNETFQNIANLTLNELLLKNDSIQWISEDAFSSLQYLKKLTISDNRHLNASSLGVSCGSFQKHLQLNIYLNAIGLKYLPDYFFQGLADGNVTTIDLSLNSIEVFNENAFRGLTTLKSLALDYNTVERKTGNGISSLVSLSMNNNRVSPFIPDFCSSSKHGSSLYPKLKTISLQNNGIVYLTETAISCLQQLSHIDLSGNVIKHLPDNVFASLANLRDLFLDGNPIRTIERHALNSSSLSDLHLSDNGIAYHSSSQYNISFENLFALLPNLQNLQFSKINLKKMSYATMSEMFRPIRNLNILSLRSVHFSELPVAILAQLPLLNSLDLSDNIIASWGQAAFSNTSNLTKLILQNNRIQTLTKHMFPSTLLSLDLGNNLFACDCSNLWFIQWMRREIASGTLKFPSYPRRYKCHSPAAWNRQYVSKYKPTKESCSLKEDHTLLVAGIGCGVFLVICVCITTIVYRSRWYIRFWIVKLRRNRREESETEPLLRDTHTSYDAYVVYTDEDRHFACFELRSLVEEKLQKKMFIRHRDGELGVATVDDMVDNLYNSKSVLVVMSNAFLSDPWCQFQLEVARYRQIEQRKEFIFLIRLSDIDSRSLSKSWCVLMTRTPTGIWSNDDLKRKLFVAQLEDTLVNSPSITDRSIN